jgi:hypothetical protein
MRKWRGYDGKIYQGNTIIKVPVALNTISFFRKMEYIDLAFNSVRNANAL